MTIGWSNYHAHTKFCDGRATMEESVDRAIQDNIKILGFSSHAPVPFHTKWTMPRERLTNYLHEIDVLKERYSDFIQIYRSLEIDYIPNLINPHSFNLFNLDYIIGSVHFVDEYPDGEPWSFDGGEEEFLNGLNQIFNNDFITCAKRYFHLVREMLWLHPPTVLGHFDKIRMHNSTTNLFNETDAWYVEEIDRTLDVIQKSGVIVEINTKAYDRGLKIFPSVDMFPKLASRNIPITINSDCHHIEKMILGFEYVAQELLNNGINKVKVFTEGIWIDVTLTAKGLELPV